MRHRELALRDVYLARQRIEGVARRTPVVEAPASLQRGDARIVYKLENLQVTGSFKVRGATNKILSLSDEERRRGVMTVSSGNHGKAVSYVARSLGVQATVVVPNTVPENKRSSIRELGAELFVAGAAWDDALETLDRLREERGLTMIHPFDDLDVIAGQGTIGLELLEDVPSVDTVVVPLSGGGLLGGIAFALKSADTSIRTIGVSMDTAPAMVESLRAGRLVQVEDESSLADALAGNLGGENHHSFEMVRNFVDETVLVTEDEIASGMAHALEDSRLVVEGGGAVGISALMSGKIRDGKNIAVVLSGSNVDHSTLLEIARGVRS
jgi:threonine dehydratase